MQTRNRKPTFQQDEQKPISKTTKGSKTLNVQDKTSVKKKNTSVSPSLDSNTRQYSKSQQHAIGGPALQQSDQKTNVIPKKGSKSPITKKNISVSASDSNIKRQSIRVSKQQVNGSSALQKNGQRTKPILKKGSKTSDTHDRTPIWKKNASVSTLFDFKTKRRSTRVSLHKNQDIYEFPCEGDKENVIKKKKRKRQIKKKKLKPKSIKTGMLTTDPLFEPTIAKSISTSNFYCRKDVPSHNRPTDTCKENDACDQSDNMDCDFDNDIVDDAGYEASISVANDTEGTCSSLANPTLFVLQTPKIALRYPGSSSTPIVYEERYDFNPFTKSRVAVPITREEEVKLCFGFDDSEDEMSIGLSPVKKSKQLSLLHQASMAIFSNVEEIEPIPSRFTSFRRPMALISDKENRKLNLKKRCTSTKDNPSKRKRKNKNQTVLEDVGINECNKSVLFDEEQEEINSGTDDLKSPSKKPKFIFQNILKHIDVQNTPSPEKSFTVPPRKSYDRKSLESIRKKFHKEFSGGYPTTDTDTENEEDHKYNHVTRRRRREKPKLKPSNSGGDGKSVVVAKTYQKKKKKQKQKENKTPSSSEKSKKNAVKSKNKNKNLDKTVSDWASDINSHFSEIDDVALLIE